MMARSEPSLNSATPQRLPVPNGKCVSHSHLSEWESDNCSHIDPCDHVVQFYESDDFLVDAVSTFIGSGIKSGEAGIIIATAPHRDAIEHLLAERGIDVPAVKAAGQLISVDAEETLSKLLVNGSLEKARLVEAAGNLLNRAGKGGRGIRAFGEMVALLWAGGNREGAIRLEELWNELNKEREFSLFCAYPVSQFRNASDAEAFARVCHAHSTVLPSEDYVAPGLSGKDRLRKIALLEQKAGSLQKEIEHRQQVEAQSRLLAAIVESSDDAIISKDLNGVITSWNRGAERIFGYTADEIIGRPVTMLMPPDRQAEEPVILSRLRMGERIDHFETIRRRKDGTELHISLTISPVKDATGRIVGASKIARDITDRKRAEKQQQVLYELASAVNRAAALPEIYDAALNAVLRSQGANRASILLFDAEGVMRFKAWRGLSDDYRRAVEGHSPWRPGDSAPQPVCIDDIGSATLDDQLRQVVIREGIRALAFLPITYEGRLLGKFMTYYDAPHHFRPEELWPVQTIISQVAFAIERQKAGENLERIVNERTASLREAIAQMEEFSYSVSHDLRAPVRAMQCYAEVLMEDYGAQLDENAKKYLDRIIRGGVRMDRLIQDILTYSRLSRREIRVQPVSLDKLTREIVRQYLDINNSSHARISIEGPLLDVLGHEASISQVISNLLSNALKFVAPGVNPEVRLRTEQRNGDVRFWVEDNGIGIKPEYQHRLFSVFERVHPEKNYEGTGIGLAIVRKAAERMGGKAGVESDGVHGSRFWIQLPSVPNP